MDGTRPGDLYRQIADLAPQLERAISWLTTPSSLRR